MQQAQGNASNRSSENAINESPQAPSISLPKGGGSIRGIGEKFSVNPSNGSASMGVPLFTTPSRAKFYPQLTISYDSGSGNGPFGLGWKLSIPSIVRKTDKGLPKYRDAEDSDIFILSDAEDLVPAFTQSEATYQRDRRIETLSDGRTYAIQRYRPRIEGLFAHIEKWQDQATGDVFWKSVSKDNVTSLYGQTAGARIASPDDPSQVFQWLLEKTYDDKGNSVTYEYKPEDSANVPRSPEEANRNGLANRCIKSIHYGNPPSDRGTIPFFLVIFDYGEHDSVNPTPNPVAPWPCRLDPFSNCRAAFEVRTYRLCRRVLMFHNFPEVSPSPALVRSTNFAYDENALCTYLTSVTQTGYLWNAETGSYDVSAFPPVEFTYSKPVVDPAVKFIDRESLENLPVGLDQTGYRWIDLDSEGISGILTEQPEAWYYKRNLGSASFAPTELLARQPSAAQPGSTRQELLDLAGDGRKALVQFAEPLAGFSERDEKGNWGPFTAFEFNPSISWSDPNLRMIDLDGDGFSDVLISGDEVFTWYQSLASKGFGRFQTVRKLTDEERGPALVFADPTQSIYLADMTGDGLADIVRIRNGEVCYWMNLGFGRFSQKILMDQSPTFDHPDSFNQRRIRLADIDGSGTTDIIYLGHDSIRFWFNQSGNSWSEVNEIQDFPPVDDLSSVSTVDLFGNGTGCIVWSSPLPEKAARPMAYIDLMSGKKPHLLTAVTNNMGSKTQIEYAASTTFYLQDKTSGSPWATRVPFPVQMVRKTITFDGIANSQLSCTYSYHEGFYDGIEREFRGFGRVETLDTDTFATYAGTGEFPAALAQELYVPPVRTKTWFHTGTFFGRGRISRHLAHQYYKGDPQAADLRDTILPPGLSGDEEREACRALKGKMLRQEVYAEDGSAQSGEPYSVVDKNYSVRMLQPFNGNPHAVFFTSERESLSYHYERNSADPRVAHELTLEVDAFGNVTKLAAIGYPRRTIGSISPAAEQLQTLCTYSESDFINQANDPSYYRLGVPSDARSYEITGMGTPTASGIYDFDVLATELPGALDIPFEATPGAGLQRRLFQRTRTLYFKNDRSGPLPLGQIESLALPYETYQMTFTPGLLTNVYGGLVDEPKLHSDGRYLKDADYIARGLFPSTDDPNSWWLPSGTRVFDPTKFYQPVQFTDAWGNSTAIAYDAYSLLTTQTTDALQNTVSAVNDYRVMLPYLVTDVNGNQAQASFDALGMVVGTAVMGKPTDAPAQGDSLAGFQAQLDEATILAHIQDPLTKPGDILQNATIRLVYDLLSFYRTKTTDQNGDEHGAPVVVYRLSRETHVSAIGSGQTKFQHQLLYSDGFGRALQTKIVAEPGLAPARGPDGQLLYGPDGNLVLRDTSPNPRWIGTGRTVYDNKGHPIKKYEPFFSSTPAYEEEKDLVQTGVTPILHYDPLGRLTRTDNPNGTFLTVEFDPWQQISSDDNDTVLQSQWYADRGSPDSSGPEPVSPPDTRAAWLAAQHANTPTIAQFDVLGRTFLSVADNGVDASGTPQKYPTRTTLDIQGNPLVITDARLNKVLTSDFDMVKRTLHTNSIDAGERWTLQDVAGKPIRSWDSNGNQVQQLYDELHRPTYTYVQQGSSPAIVAERLVYADRLDSHTPSPPEQANLRGKVYQSYDGAGGVTNERYDFKGNLLQGARQLTKDPAFYRQQMDWAPLGVSNDVQAIMNNAAPLLESESFTHSATYDALNRPVNIKTPDQSIERPSYNERRLLNQINVYMAPTGNMQQVVRKISYNEKGQRLECDYGNAAVTKYSYDRETFRLAELKTTRPNSGGKDALQDLSYFYDPVGNVVEVDDTAQPTIFFSNAVVTANSKYAYDPIYRLTKAAGREHLGQAAGQLPPQYAYNDAWHVGLPQPGDGNAMANYIEQYQYDPVGNITQVSHQLPSPFTSQSWTRSYQNDTTSNRLLSTSLPGDLTTPYSAKYQYDLNGNTTAMLHLQPMQWDFKNELRMTQRQAVNVNDADGILHQGERTYYVYDGTGQRVRKVTESSAGTRLKERIYLSGYELYREYGPGITGPSLERQTLHTMDDNQRVAMVETKTIDVSVPSTSLPVSVTRYQFDSHVGSACLELDDSATPAIISYEEYYPYGATSYQAVNGAIEVSAKRYRYNGKERDEETGFYYHGARYYAPWLGRWISCDPAGLIDGLSLYRSFRDNPLRFSDLSGTASNDAKKPSFTVTSPNSDRFLGREAHQAINTEIARRINEGPNKDFYKAQTEVRTGPGGSSKPGSNAPGRKDLEVYSTSKGNENLELKPEGRAGGAPGQVANHSLHDESGFSSKPMTSEATKFAPDALDPVVEDNRVYLVRQTEKPGVSVYQVYDVNEVKTPAVEYKPTLPSSSPTSPAPTSSAPVEPEPTVRPTTAKPMSESARVGMSAGYAAALMIALEVLPEGLRKQFLDANLEFWAGAAHLYASLWGSQEKQQAKAIQRAIDFMLRQKGEPQSGTLEFMQHQDYVFQGMKGDDPQWKYDPDAAHEEMFQPRRNVRLSF